MSALDDANARQRAAADPARDVFVAASAGSGKTKLLTDRLLRLMLDGAPPGRILCLTFTKAGAAEMALRLRARLAAWVTMGEAELAVEMLELGVGAGQAGAARALFGKVLDLPGGMRIETIHAFCQSLLRRFPLEALISPHFRLADERDTIEALAEARAHVLAGVLEESALATVSRLVGLPDFAALLGELVARRGRLGWLDRFDEPGRRECVRAAAGVRDADEAALLRRAVAWPEAEELRAQLAIAARLGSKTVAERAQAMCDWLDLPVALRADPVRWEQWRDQFLDAAGAPRGFGRFPNPTLDKTNPDIRRALEGEQSRVGELELDRAGLRMAEATVALLELARPILHRYALRKDRAAQLDYDDLISLTLGLLRDPGVGWVLYKLDGGIDHVLLDEVQDTSPDQWRIARAITDEFFAGVGARERARSFFAVGDRKQSIFSFQGADIESFERQRREIAALAEAAGRDWLGTSLDVSFRSTEVVLKLVDAVFDDPVAGEGVAIAGEKVRHQSSRAGQAGEVLLWPLAPPPPVLPQPEIASANLRSASPASRLADRLAAWIKAQTDGSVMLEGRGRALRPGDVMILVRRRDAFARTLVRQLKALEVPVAGLDRMLLTEQPAVRDLLALCDCLLLPDDDLALGCVLTSPLGGLDDDGLMALAMARPAGQRLWDALRLRAGERAEWAGAWEYVSGLFARVDFDTPHALLEAALARGRARLFARLGPEAAEPVDELLAAARAFEAQHPPSLQGFVHWLRQTAAQITRQPGGSEADEVRLLTVHGAKGLQAPLVILADTTGLPPDRPRLVWAGMAGDALSEVPLWSPRGELRGAAARRIADEERVRALEEYNRLLYVALTRAQDRLLVCGWQPKRGAVSGQSWYAAVSRAMDRLGAETVEFAPWDEAGSAGCLMLSQPQSVAVARVPAAAPARVVAPALPGWAGQAPAWLPAPPPDEPARPQPLAPSRPEGQEFGPLPASLSPLEAGGGRGAAIERGLLLHALLQHLPSLPPEARGEAARRHAERAAPGLGAEIAAEATAVIDSPALAPLFGPGSRAEVPLTGVVGQQVIGGLVDRLVVLPERVMLADYKTNRRAPATPEATPVRYLRQMAAYRALLAAIYPNREILCILVWTHGGGAMQLPSELLDRHAPGEQIGD